MLRPSWKTFVIILALPLASLATAKMGISLSRSRAFRNDEGRQVAEKFLKEVGAGRTDPAWKDASVEFKSLMGSASLRDYARAHPALNGTAEYLNSRPIDANGFRLVEYQFRAILSPAGSDSKTPPTGSTIRVMVSFNDRPARVDRLSVE